MGERERNVDTIRQTKYIYLYTPDSKVFHRKSCKLILSANEICGCEHYEAAKDGRRPCKVCKPTVAEDSNDYFGDVELDESRDEIVSAKLLGDNWVRIAKRNLVGYCHASVHPGKLTVKIMEQHDCIGKNCVFFEKYKDSSYWLGQLQKQKQKKIAKVNKQAKKEQEKAAQEGLARAKELLQSYADASGYKMLIVRVEQVRKKWYRVFYVSENKFCDGDRFRKVTEAAKASYQNCRIQLRHIKGVDNRFVTIEEYLRLKR